MIQSIRDAIVNRLEIESGGVSSLNGLTGDLDLVSGDGSIVITPSGSTIDLSAAASEGAFLKLDQTVHQEVINGAPDFQGSKAGYAFNVVRDQQVTFGRDYTDPASTPDGQILSSFDGGSGLTSLSLQCPFGQLVLHGGGGDGVVIPDNVRFDQDLLPQITLNSNIGSSSKVLSSLFTGRIGNLTTNGFVKTSGSDGSLSIDTGSYLPTSLTNTHLLVGNGSNIATDVAASGDLTLANTGAFTFNTVNSNVGSFGAADSVGTFTVNGKGLITAASNTSIQIAESQVTGLVTDLGTFIKKDGTTTTTGSIPFALGWSSAGNISINKASPTFTWQYSGVTSTTLSSSTTGFNVLGGTDSSNINGATVNITAGTATSGNNGNGGFVRLVGGSFDPLGDLLNAGFTTTGTSINGFSGSNTVSGSLLIGNSINDFACAGNFYAATTAIFAADGIGVGGRLCPANYMLLGKGTAAQIIGMDRASTAAGFALTLQAGWALSSTTNNNAGNLILATGKATGNGGAQILLQAAGGGASGSTDATPTTVFTIGYGVNSGSVGGASGTATLAGGAGGSGAGGAGGTLNAVGGVGGSSTGVGGAAGTLNISGGAAATSGNGGAAGILNLSGGVANTTHAGGAAGNISANGGSAGSGGNGGVGGTINIAGGAGNAGSGAGGTGGSFTATGGAPGTTSNNGVNAGSINISAGARGTTGAGGTGASFTGTGGAGNTTGAGGNAGNITTSGAGGFASHTGGAGGNINTAGGVSTSTATGGSGGAITTSGSAAVSSTAGANGGAITTSASGAQAGGNINTSGGGTAAGGSITTSNGGGSIDTTGTGSIQFGVAATQTTLQGNATAARTVNMQDVSHTIVARTDSVALTNQGADIGATNFAGASTAGQYRINYVLLDTTADLTAGTVTLTISWTDDAGATTATASQLLTGTGRTSGNIYIQQASGNVNYAVTHTGIFGSAKYALYMTCEKFT